ncbi:MAG TPA: BNR-4 repeat-containing protein [Thermoguttaceae bacterium]|nr:BNR-4 repeat-containing protein [Thermoguttaceae bacterium]
MTHEGRQFIAFYDANRQMTVGSRSLDSDRWQLVSLPSKLGWDSHHSITMTIDVESRSSPSRASCRRRAS